MYRNNLPMEGLELLHERESAPKLEPRYNNQEENLKKKVTPAWTESTTC